MANSLNQTSRRLSLEYSMTLTWGSVGTFASIPVLACWPTWLQWQQPGLTVLAGLGLRVWGDLLRHSEIPASDAPLATPYRTRSSRQHPGARPRVSPFTTPCPNTSRYSRGGWCRFPNIPSISQTANLYQFYQSKINHQPHQPAPRSASGELQSSFSSVSSTLLCPNEVGQILVTHPSGIYMLQRMEQDTLATQRHYLLISGDLRWFL